MQDLTRIFLCFFGCLLTLLMLMLMSLSIIAPRMHLSDDVTFQGPSTLLFRGEPDIPIGHGELLWVRDRDSWMELQLFNIRIPHHHPR